MLYINNTTLGGKIQGDIETIETRNGGLICKFTLQQVKKWTDKAGVSQEKENLIDCQSFGGTAKYINNHLGNGSNVLIEGEITANEWEGRDGSKKSKMEVTALRIHSFDRNSEKMPF